MTYPPNLNKLLGYIPADVYAESEKQITKLADAIAKDRQRLKEVVLKNWRRPDFASYADCAYCEQFSEYYEKPHSPICIVRQLEEEGDGTI